MKDRVFDREITVPSCHTREPQIDIWQRVVGDLTTRFQENLNFYKGPATFRLTLEVETKDE